MRFPPGTTTRTVKLDVQTLDFSDGEPDETFSVGLVGTQNADPSAPATVTILDDDVALSINNATAVEGDPLRFLVSLNAATTGTVTVDWTTQELTIGDTATADVDYTAGNGTLTFAPGAQFQVITVETRPDTDPEPDEKLNVVLSNPQGASITEPIGTGTILDGGPRQLTITGNTATEGRPLTFTLALNKRRNQPTPLVVRVDTGSGDPLLGALASPADYTFSGSGSYTIPARSLSVTFTVPTVPDTLDEDTERLLLRVDAPAGIFNDGTPGVGLIEDDDDPPTVSVTGPGTVSEGDDAVFTIELSGASGRSLSVYASTAPGTAGVSDYLHHEGRIDFQPGVEQREITVTTVEDTAVESDETFTLRLTAPQNVTLAADTALVTIRDDDTGLSVADADPVEEGEPLEFVVTLGQAVSGPVTFSYTTHDGTGDNGATAPDDYTRTTGSHTILAGTTTATITVATHPDTEIEGFEHLQFELTGATGADIEDPDATGTINDAGNALPVLTIEKIEVEEGNIAEIVLELDRSSTEHIAFTLSTWNYRRSGLRASPDHDYENVGRIIAFPPGATRAVMYVPTVDDVLNEADEIFGLELRALSLEPQVSSLGRWDDAVTIQDNDPIPTVSVEGPGEVVEGETAVFTLRLSASSGVETSIWVVTISGTAGTADFIPQAERIYFRVFYLTPGEREARVLVPTINDGEGEGPETFSLRLSGPSPSVHLGLTATPSAQVTILDDDVVVSVGDSAELEGGTLSFEVALNAPSREDVTVDWETVEVSADDAATRVDDFVEVLDGEVTILAGALSATVEVFSVLDDVFEGDERFQVLLSNPRGAPLGDAIGVGTIIDDDTTVSVTGASAPEGAPVRFVVRLSEALSRPVVVGYRTEDLLVADAATAGDDYEAVTAGELAVVTVPAGQTEAPLAVVTLSDDEDELDERFGLLLSSTSLGVLAADPSAEGVILNTELPLLSVEADPGEVVEGTDAGFVLRLSAASADVVVATVSTVAASVVEAATVGDDFTALPANFEVTIGAGATEARFAVPTVDDSLDEYDVELFDVVVSLPADAAAVLVDRTATGRILDNDDAPELIIDAPGQVDEGDTVTFMLRLGEASGRPVTISYDTAGAADTGSGALWPATPARVSCADVPADAHGDFEHTSGTVTIAAGTTTAVPLTVPTCDDETTEADGTYARGGAIEAIQLTANSPAIAAPAQAVVNIRDNDPLPILTIGNAEADEGDDLVFTLELDRRSELDTQVLEWAAGSTTYIMYLYISSFSLPTDELNRANASDYELVSRPVLFTFPATTAEFRIPTNRDTDPGDADREVFTFGLRSTRYIDIAASKWTDVADPKGLGTIRDRPVVTVSLASEWLSRIEGEEAVLTVMLSQPLDHDLTLTYWTSESPDPATVRDQTYRGRIHPLTNVPAQAGLDFPDIPPSVGAEVTIVAGHDQLDIPISILPDEELEEVEVFIVGIDLPPDVTDVAPRLGSPLRAKVLITDNDWRRVNMTTPVLTGFDTVLTEGESVTVDLALGWHVADIYGAPSSLIPTISPAAPENLTLEITARLPEDYPSNLSHTHRNAFPATAGTDFTMPPSVTIPAGSTTASFVIEAVVDFYPEGTECFFVDLAPGAGIPTDDFLGLPYGLVTGYFALICIEDSG